MASQYEKRKLKEADLDKEALDVVQLEDGSYVVVRIKYNLESGRCEIGESAKTTRLIALGFDERKKALRQLAKIK